MATFNDLPLELQDKIMKKKADLEKKEKNDRMMGHYTDAMFEFLDRYGLWEKFRNEFLDDLDDGEDLDDWKEFLGVEEE
jgi:hypothetical protein